MVLSESERRLDLVDRHRQVDATALGPRSFVLHEVTGEPGRRLAPDDDHAARGIEVLANGLPPRGPTPDVQVPPNRQPLRGQGVDEEPDPGAILGLVVLVSRQIHDGPIRGG
jgi:hypothetical protein